MGNKIEGPLTYWECKSLLGNRATRNICNNTHISWIDPEGEDRVGKIGLMLHRTYVIQYKENGDIILNSGGWQTVTTKDRLNNYVRGISVYSNKGEWVICNNTDHVEYEYEDNMTVYMGGVNIEFSTLPTYLRVASKVLGQEFNSVEQFNGFVQEAEQPILKKLFNRRNEGIRQVVAQHGSLDYIPLIVAKSTPSDTWGQYAAERLAEGR